MRKCEKQKSRLDALGPLVQLIVAASNHHNLRHTVQEALALLDVTARTVVLFEIAQLAAEAAGDEGLQVTGGWGEVYRWRRGWTGVCVVVMVLLFDDAVGDIGRLAARACR